MSFTLFGTQKAVVVSSEQAIRDVLVNQQDQFSGQLRTTYKIQRLFGTLENLLGWCIFTGPSNQWWGTTGYLSRDKKRTIHMANG